MSASTIRFKELASPQILDDKWRELRFDPAPGHNIIQDCVMPDSGSGYVYREAKSIGSATHNRFIYWRTTNDVLEFVELSTEVNLEDNQVRIRFVNSPIVNTINVIEFPESIAIVLATMTSVHRIFLPHPKVTNRSIFSSLTSDVLFDQANYYLLGNQNNSSSNKPICATSWHEEPSIKCALSFPDSSILIIHFGFGYQAHQITTSEIKQTGIIGRLWSRMPNLWAKSPDECDNAIFASVPFHHPDSNDVLLITLCRDCRIRIFSSRTKECVCSFNMIPQSSFHQSFTAHANPSNEIPMIKMIGSYIIIYLSENKPEFVFLQHAYSDNVHELRECVTLQAPDWLKLVDFGVTKKRIWALANMCETETVVCYMDLEQVVEKASHDASIIEGSWEFVSPSDIPEPTNSKNLVTEIFWRNHFSIATIKKALVGILGPSISSQDTIKGLEELAVTKINDDNKDSAWKKFYEYCLQNHMSSNKPVGLILSDDDRIVGIAKKSNPSLICPWYVNNDHLYQEGPYRGMEFSTNSYVLAESLNFITNDLVSEYNSDCIEAKLMGDSNDILTTIDEVVEMIYSSNNISILRPNNLNKASIVAGVDDICDELDFADQASTFGESIIQECSTKMKYENNPLGSSTGILITYELFRRVVKARMILARDLLLYIGLMAKHSRAEKTTSSICEELYTSGRVRRLCDSLRSYAILSWLADSPIRSHPACINVEIIEYVARYFQFFKTAGRPLSICHTVMDTLLHQNLMTYFLYDGGASYHWNISQLTSDKQAISSSYNLMQTVLNLCKLLWPQSGNLCFDEFLFTRQLDEMLVNYQELTEGWVECCLPDRHFISACNYIIQNRANQAVDIFNRLWIEIKQTNLIGRFVELDQLERRDTASIDPGLIDRYYSKLIQFFQIYNNRHCLVTLINNCMSLLESNDNDDQLQSINSLRAKLFQYYLELEESDEAYHTMVLTSDPSLRINCLRKFIVSHCAKEQWINLLSYPFIDIKTDFIDILNQKAESFDLSSLDGKDFYKTSYYDLLFASHIMDEEYKPAAEIMYDYAQRLAQEVPGITSIRKQVDCLLVALNSLRCVDEKERYIECKRSNSSDARSSVLKRPHDCESDQSKLQVTVDDNQTNSATNMKVSCQDIEKSYELTKARLKLLEKDQSANTIALSPLKPEETINQLVTSSLFSTAVDLALLFRSSMDHIMEGLASKYIMLIRVSTTDIAVFQEIERGLTDLFVSSYNNIDTYNYVANSTSPLIDRLWRLIDYYLTTYDGVNHRYSSGYIVANSTPTTVLMRVVANKLLSAGYSVPAGLRRLYILRNPSELLKLMMKYDKLDDATELAIEMIDRILEPANCYTIVTSLTKNDRPPVYLPTHLIQLLLTFLNEDATDTDNLKIANNLTDRLEKYRTFVKAN